MYQGKIIRLCCVLLFIGWLHYKKYNTNFEEYSKTELANLLTNFYPSIRNKNGEPFAIQTLINCRSGINRYLSLPPFNSDWNLMKDIEFNRANKILKGVRRKIKQDGNDRSKRKPVLSKSEIMKIYRDYLEPYFDKNPVCLQHKVFFDIAYFNGRRGCEGLRELRKNSFEIKEFENGQQYIQLTYNERSKKSQGDEPGQHPRENIILSQPGSRKCPVYSFKLYMSKLSPNIDSFFQRPNKKFEKDGKWYHASLLGKNAVSALLPTICEKVHLQRKYTNHCLRGTTATAMKKLGYSVVDIANVTNHKSHQSLSSYLERATLEDRRNYCNSLFTFTGEDSHSAESTLCTQDTPNIDSASVDDEGDQFGEEGEFCNNDGKFDSNSHCDGIDHSDDEDDDEVSFPKLQKERMANRNTGEMKQNPVLQNVADMTSPISVDENESRTKQGTTNEDMDTTEYSPSLHVMHDENLNSVVAESTVSTPLGLEQSPDSLTVDSVDNFQSPQMIADSFVANQQILSNQQSYGTTACLTNHPTTVHSENIQLQKAQMLNKEKSQLIPGIISCSQMSNCTITVHVSK